MSHPTETRRPIRRALISVYDKTGLEELATVLDQAGVEILSTGSTAATIAAAGISVTPVEKVTGFPECLEGRVKTLHPHIHAGILADCTKPTHLAELNELNVTPIDLVVVNLYPFTATVAAGTDFAGCIEQIDIGGPTMIRAAAKNHSCVAVVTNPQAYREIAEEIRAGGFTASHRFQLAAQAFSHTAAYDAAVASWFAGQNTQTPAVVGGQWELIETLRYGENPQQKGAVYRTKTLGFGGELTEANGIANAQQLSGKAMSYNNYTDGDAALRAAYDHTEPCVAIIKHANPCGIAIGTDIAQAHLKAHACDPVSAFGGVIAVNRPVSVTLAKQIAPIFTEVVIAPDYEPGAAEILATKKNLRVLKVVPPHRETAEFKQISGGLVVQEPDTLTDRGDNPANWTLVSGKAADETTLKDLEFAWKAVRAVRSNAILLVKDGASVGVGMGQVNRVDSCTLAVTRANTLGERATADAAQTQVKTADETEATVEKTAPPQRAQGAVAASDAFFPFADGLQILIDAGVKAVVQPGGSIRDEEVIAAAQAAGITMYFTGNRHFSH
ncbi:bifunctional phosphoribosylaminoimidazolecarboxamide formyltransferase/IMP cyclohydrolase [Gleimia sp. 6138-11-ORH1]|uniref:bifunctional phosphoribosylaminoimidazolecarboxamide formyltransferase/IMP cyclohydrolase n=1 Tax=Gleimia sp. 6138-11-ORH1 TaxID=2973937 RepID=UPI0021695258|nr:bifunctional phosphoribosylaminoimidazolecarboxamide formyltransferase/IMP cyclohydrolase [Gleimia sp. 6138-11-ORH1]MCS4485190.1 bifunctional phosphoribosylaminoimidazolecarboxamide formyltransferase/IMP cyclohydrolase [Gleimia sp. 6138-11-ORH1]